MSTDFLALRLFCFNIRSTAAKSYILNYMWTAANFIIDGRRLCTVALDELLFRLRCTTTNLSIFPRTLLTITVPEIRTTGGTTAIVTHCATRAEFLRHSMYEAVSLHAIMTHESQRLYRKATFSEGFL